MKTQELSVYDNVSDYPVTNLTTQHAFIGNTSLTSSFASIVLVRMIEIQKYYTIGSPTGLAQFYENEYYNTWEVLETVGLSWMTLLDNRYNTTIGGIQSFSDMQLGVNVGRCVLQDYLQHKLITRKLLKQL